MKDPVLDQDIDMMHKLQEEWKLFLDIISQSLKYKTIPSEKEEEFMKVKSNLAMYHDEFVTLAEEDPQTAQNMLSLVARTISLKHLRRLSAAEVKKIEIEWHEVNFLLNNVIGELEEKRERTNQINPMTFKGKKVLANIGLFFSSLFHNTALRVIVALVILVGGLLAVDHMWGEQLNQYQAYQLIQENFITHIHNFLN